MPHNLIVLFTCNLFDVLGKYFYDGPLNVCLYVRERPSVSYGQPYSGPMPMHIQLGNILVSTHGHHRGDTLVSMGPQSSGAIQVPSGIFQPGVECSLQLQIPILKICLRTYSLQVIL